MKNQENLLENLQVKHAGFIRSDIKSIEIRMGAEGFYIEWSYFDPTGNVHTGLIDFFQNESHKAQMEVLGDIPDDRPKSAEEAVTMFLEADRLTILMLARELLTGQAIEEISHEYEKMLSKAAKKEGLNIAKHMTSEQLARKLGMEEMYLEAKKKEEGKND